MTVNVPAFLSVRHARFLVVSTNDLVCRGGFPTEAAARAHAGKKIVGVLAGGSPLIVVEKSAVALLGAS